MAKLFTVNDGELLLKGRRPETTLTFVKHTFPAHTKTARSYHAVSLVQPPISAHDFAVSTLDHGGFATSVRMAHFVNPGTILTHSTPVALSFIFSSFLSYQTLSRYPNINPPLNIPSESSSPPPHTPTRTHSSGHNVPHALPTAGFQL